MSEFVPPTKDELKRKYGIADDDFEVLTEAPDNLTIQQKGYLIKLGEVFTATEWMWRSWCGRVIAIIVICPTAVSIYNFWQPKLAMAYDEAVALVEEYAPDEEQPWVAVYPKNSVVQSDRSHVPIADFPPGTGLYPYPPTGTGTGNYYLS